MGKNRTNPPENRKKRTIKKKRQEGHCTLFLFALQYVASHFLSYFVQIILDIQIY